MRRSASSAEGSRCSPFAVPWLFLQKLKKDERCDPFGRVARSGLSSTRDCCIAYDWPSAQLADAQSAVMVL